MKAIQYFQGFALISFGIIVTGMVGLSMLFWYRGASLYYQDAKEVKRNFVQSLVIKDVEPVATPKPMPVVEDGRMQEGDIFQITQDELYDVAKLNAEVRRNLMKALKKIENS
jgi:hypothetical protein